MIVVMTWLLRFPKRPELFSSRLALLQETIGEFVFVFEYIRPSANLPLSAPCSEGVFAIMLLGLCGISRPRLDDEIARLIAARVLQLFVSPLNMQKQTPGMFLNKPKLQFSRFSCCDHSYPFRPFGSKVQERQWFRQESPQSYLKTNNKLTQSYNWCALSFKWHCPSTFLSLSALVYLIT